jgi:hypothetical protein
MTNIFYAYDSQTGSFSALPASPWLLPAMGAFALLAAYQKYKLSRPSIIGEAPEISPVIRDIYGKRYRELIHKKHWQGGLDFRESIELQNIQNPPWAEPGEVWTY